jgi:hypothetical protein
LCSMKENKVHCSTTSLTQRALYDR